MDLSQWEWTCTCCGERKHGVPDFAFDAPIHHYWSEQGETEFKVLKKDSDFCEMEISGQKCFFIRCVLRLPVLRLDSDFGLGLWSTLGEPSFNRYAETYPDTDQSKIGPMFGYLANRLPAYPDTLNLKADLLPQDGNQRPLLRLWDEAAEHPLYIDQALGLDLDRFATMLSGIMPCSRSA